MDPYYIKSPLVSIAFYGGATVSFWAECLPEVQTLKQEVQGIQGKRQWGKPASVRRTAKGCQLPIRLPPCGVRRPCLERSVVTSDRGAQTTGPRCCGIEEQKCGINILPLIPQGLPHQGNQFTTNNHIP